MAPPSPCRQICALDTGKRYCIGFGRPAIAIFSWAKLSEAEKHRVLDELTSAGWLDPRARFDPAK